MFGHLLLPTDGSAVSYEAIRAGMAFAREAGARVTGYYALPPRHVPSDDLDRDMHARYDTRARELGDSYLAALADAAQEHGVACEVFMDYPAAAYQGILKAARDRGCDLVFMASHGRTGGPVQILGSVAQKVVALSQVPVLVYRTP